MLVKAFDALEQLFAIQVTLYGYTFTIGSVVFYFMIFGILCLFIGRILK